MVWAPPRSLATTRGIHLFSSPYLDVSVRAVPSAVPMYSARGATPYRVAGCPIRRSSDHGLVPAPRRLSQLPTSFFGTRRQGIHRMLVLPSSSVPRLTKQPSLIAWMRYHVPSSWRKAHSAQARLHSSTQSLVRSTEKSLVPCVATRSNRPSRSRTRRDVSSAVKVHSPTTSP